MRKAVITLAFLTGVAACGGGDATTTTSITTTSLAPTTTGVTAPSNPTTTAALVTTTVDPSIVTILPEGFRSPVNGLRAELETDLDRSAIAVKIDNHPDARPQSGLNEADAVIELLVEGGFTRFIAVFHDDDSEYLGPVRSLRPTDSTIVTAIPAPLVISGGQPWVQSLAAGRGVDLIGESGPGLFRTPSRTAPHNLYGNTERLRETAVNRGYGTEQPQWLYDVGEWRIPDAPATTVILSWSAGSVITWKYEGGVYSRWYGSTPHNLRTRDGDTVQVTAEVLVILTGREYTATPLVGEGTPVPATETTGSGGAWVISRGAVWEGTWERSEITDQFQLFNVDGTEAVVPPGIVWVSIFPSDRSITINP